MLKKFTLVIIATFALTFNSFSASDGELLLKKMIQLKLKIVLKNLIEQLLHLTNL